MNVSTRPVMGMCGVLHRMVGEGDIFEMLKCNEF